MNTTLQDNDGLTIAFICNGNQHPTIINYKKFGNQYWDDSQNNNSKIGYYFAYYFRQKYVYIHKIINILQPEQRPALMEWDSDRQILCLSNRIKEFTWDEWTTGIGLGAPYTPTYRMTQTGSWSRSELQNHKKYQKFNFMNFKNAIEQQNTNITTILSCDKKYENNDNISEEEKKDNINNDEECDITSYLEKYQDDSEIFISAKQTIMSLIELKKKLQKLVSSQEIKELKRDKLLVERKKYQDIVDNANMEISKLDIEIQKIMIN